MGAGRRGAFEVLALRLDSIVRTWGHIASEVRELDFSGMTARMIGLASLLRRAIKEGRIQEYAVVGLGGAEGRRGKGYGAVPN